MTTTSVSMMAVKVGYQNPDIVPGKGRAVFG
jgi:hypothetical protein